MLARLHLTNPLAPRFARLASIRPIGLGRLSLSSNCIFSHASSGAIHHTPRLSARVVYTHSYTHQHYSHKASVSSHLIIATVLGGSVAVATYLYSSSSEPENDPICDSRGHQEAPTQVPLRINLVMHPDAGPGHVGNLTEEQEAKLREFWAVTFKLFGLEGQNGEATAAPTAETTIDDGTSTIASTPEKKKSKRRLGLFGSKKAKENGVVDDGASSINVSLEDDKYGHTKEFQKTVSEFSPEELRTGFWSQVKIDHPDGLMLRFLRARKWDVDKALIMMIATMRWRVKEMRVDDEIIIFGEGGALEATQGSDQAAAKEAEDFIRQIRLGKSVLHGADREGRPICQVRVRLHRAAEQSVSSLEKYTVFTIETARLMLVPPVETACLIFDMTNFTLANMDYTPVKFMIKCFEANYPESLGSILIHRAPWIFQGIWRIIRGWLDPVVAAKVHFTNTLEDLEVYIPRENVIKELGGPEEWEYSYTEPSLPAERAPSASNLTYEEKSKRESLLCARAETVSEYQRKTLEWIAAGGSIAAPEVQAERNRLVESLRTGYWELDPYVRTRSLADRTGVINPEGTINFYPERTGTAGQIIGATVKELGGGFLAPPNGLSAINGGSLSRTSSLESFRTAQSKAKEEDVD